MSESQIIVAFTDGACSGNPGPGGWGAIVADLNADVVELGGGELATTNNRMEIMAALAAVEKILSMRLANDAVVKICADSKYTIDGITKWISGWKRRDWRNLEGDEVKNRDLWERLDRVFLALSKKVRCEWIYVPAHSGVEANERCDTIAVAFSKNEPLNLYKGETSNYKVDLSIPEKGEKKDPYYLSYINGKIYRDLTWPACQARVQGARGAKYKKCRSSREEQELFKLWGVKI